MVRDDTASVPPVVIWYPVRSEVFLVADRWPCVVPIDDSRATEIDDSSTPPLRRTDYDVTHSFDWIFSFQTDDSQSTDYPRLKHGPERKEKFCQAERAAQVEPRPVEPTYVGATESLVL